MFISWEDEFYRTRSPLGVLDKIWSRRPLRPSDLRQVIATDALTWWMALSMTRPYPLQNSRTGATSRLTFPLLLNFREKQRPVPVAVSSWCVHNRLWNVADSSELTYLCEIHVAPRKDELLIPGTTPGDENVQLKQLCRAWWKLAGR